MIERWRRAHRARGTESGQAAGIETIPFGILVFIGGLLLVVNVWAVVDTRAALDTAARDYLRAYTSSSTSALGRAAGREAALASMGARAHGRAVEITAPDEPFGPCRPATVELRLEVPAIRAPFIGSIGTTAVTATETELVQPYGDARDETIFATPSACDG